MNGTTTPTRTGIPVDQAWEDGRKSPTREDFSVLSPSARMNVTRDETRARALLVSVDSYQVALDLTRGDTTFPSRTAVAFTCARPGAATFLDLVAEEVSEIVLNGRRLDPAEVFDGTRIRLEDLAGENTLTVSALCCYMHTGEGLHRFVDPVDKSVYLYSQFEVADSRRVFAVFEQPDLKATFAFTVTAPDVWQVVSNQPSPSPEPAGEGAATWRFAPTERISSYITALVAGPYHRVTSDYRDGDRVVPLGIYCRASLAEHLDPEVMFEETRQGFAFFEQSFGRPYPFAKYDQLFVPEFNAGAMENAGCVTHNEDYVFRSRVPVASYERRCVTILHELAHMWFGDLVTMTWWDDLWLNESFAEWASTLAAAEATRYHSSWTTFATTEKTWAYRQDQLPSTHPIAAEINDLEDVEVNFDGITYAKGASVLKLLAAWVGRDEFLAGIKAYFDAYAWGNTTLADLLGKLEETSGRDLAAWSAEWLQTAGVNTLRPEIATDDDGRVTSFAVLQSAPEQWPTLRSHRLAVGLYDRTGEGLVRRDRVELDVTGPRTEVEALVGVAAPDLVLVNDDDLTYAKIRLDPRSLRTVTESIGEIGDSLARSLCWTAAWDMTRDAELPTRDFVTLVLGGVAEETDSSVARTLLRQVESAVALFSERSVLESNRVTLGDGLLRLLVDADPGSDLQLLLARSFASAAVSDSHLDRVQGLLDGTDALAGLEVDVDLRWALLHRLSASGRLDDAELERAQDADDTATGRRHAAAARAARPTEAAKAAAWTALIDDDSLPNAIQTAVISGFAQVGQHELVRPYVDRYFAALTTIWEQRTNETAQALVVGLFPTLLAEQSVLEAADTWLADHEDAAPALRRLVTESRDGVARAIRAQQCEAAATAGTPAV